MEVKITLKYHNEKTAKAIAQAILPDNFNAPAGLDVETVKQDCTVITQIVCYKELPTFIATIDDLLHCASIAEKAILSVKRNEK